MKGIMWNEHATVPARAGLLIARTIPQKGKAVLLILWGGKRPPCSLGIRSSISPAMSDFLLSFLGWAFSSASDEAAGRRGFLGKGGGVPVREPGLKLGAQCNAGRRRQRGFPCQRGNLFCCPCPVRPRAVGVLGYWHSLFQPFWANRYFQRA